MKRFESGLPSLLGAVLVTALSASGAWAQSPAADADLPPNAKAGQCYARVLVPASYETITETVELSPATARVEVSKPRYEWVEEKVVVREASQKLEVVPATYEWAQEEVVVKPASFELIEVPAEYEWTEEKIEIKPARTVWKKGRGPVEKVDDATGEIMCLVEEPAEYETVRKRLLKSAAATKKVEIPAVTKVVKKRVVKTPPTTKKLEIPAEYKTVRVQKLVEPAKETKIEIPAKTDQITRRELKSEARREWREILCETNIRPGTVQALQRALHNAGHDPGPIDGVVGRATLDAVASYQRAKGLPSGGLTLATLDSLGVQTR